MIADPHGRLRTRALLLSGQVDVDRLLAAAADVLAAVELPGPEIAVRQFSCDGATVLAELAAGGEGSIRAVRTGEEDVVLALSAPPGQLDLRSVYLLLGAVMQAYFGRFRGHDYPRMQQVADTPLLRADPSRRRITAWNERFDRWPSGPAPGDGPGPRHTARLVLAEELWGRLQRIAPHSGNTASIAVIALLTWWYRTRAPRPRGPVYSSTLDLRELCGFGSVLGPLTDRIVFDVDESGFSAQTFTELVRRTHLGLLDAVVRYVPFDRLPLPALPRGSRPPWDVAVHYCKAPPSSSHTRGETSLARLGMSIEIYAEAELAAADLGNDASASLEVDITEAPRGVAILLDADTRVLTASHLETMAADLDVMSEAVAERPDVPMTRLTRR